MSASNNGGPYLAVTSDDHRAIVVIIVVTCVIWSVMVMGARLIWRLHQKSDFGLDDTVALLGTLLSVVQAGLTLRGVNIGIGKASSLLKPGQTAQAGEYIYSASIIYILALCASKCSMPLLIARLTRVQTQVMWTYILLGITAAWGVGSALGLAFACGIHVPWIGVAESTCTGLFTAWVAIEAIGLLLEVFYLAMAIALVQNLHMLLKFKLAVVGSFSLRMLLIIPVIFRLMYLKEADDSSDPFFSRSNATIATQALLHYSLWAASFPCMRAFLRAFDTGLGVTTGMSTHQGSNYQNDSKSASFAMRSFNRDNTASPTSRPETGFAGPDSIEKIATSYPPSRDLIGRNGETERSYRARKSDEGSDSSGKPIISRTVEWKITYEDAPGKAM